MLHRVSAAIFAAASVTLSAAWAEDVRLTPEMASRSIDLGGETVVIDRIQDPQHVIDPEFARTSRPCPPFCIQPLHVADGVETVGELELISFLDNYVSPGRGLLIDSRVPAWYSKGTIPGAVNVPFSTLDPENPYRDEILKALGARAQGSGWDFSNALHLMMFCNGPWCEQSPTAIRNLIQAGYPVDRLHYYRGGMQMWLMLGLSVKNPNPS